MKILSVNINPPDKCADSQSFDKLSDDERKKRIIKIIQDENPDVIFFIEQWYPVFNLVKEELEDENAKPKYHFCFPSNFNPSYCKNGEYPSYAGVVAAVKSTTKSDATDGTDKVNKSAKWLCLEIENNKYLGVHYPQPIDDKTPDENFHNGVKEFAKNNKPLVIIGDFNTPKNSSIVIDGYKDFLPENEPTSAFKTKLDYIFLPENYNGEANVKLLHNARSGENFFSDHSATIVAL